MTAPVLVLLPVSPGDLIACRSLLVELKARTPIHLLLREELLPLVADLADAPICYRLPWQDDLSGGPLERALAALNLPHGAPVIDMIGMTASWKLIDSLGLSAIGWRVQPSEELPYTTEVAWSLPTATSLDTSHFSVRLLRAIPEYRSATDWPEGVFDRALYLASEGPSPNRLALAPGCGRAGNEKRMPGEFWCSVAEQARYRKLIVTWYLGPDESELADVLVDTGKDEVVDGSWGEVIAAHRRDALGISNDTCHMHIRAHLQRPTLAFFRRGELQEWGGYPRHVDCVDARGMSVENTVEAATQWLDRKIADWLKNTLSTTALQGKSGAEPKSASRLSAQPR